MHAIKHRCHRCAYHTSVDSETISIRACRSSCIAIESSAWDKQSDSSTNAALASTRKACNCEASNYESICLEPTDGSSAAVWMDRPSLLACSVCRPADLQPPISHTHLQVVCSGCEEDGGAGCVIAGRWRCRVCTQEATIASAAEIEAKLGIKRDLPGLAPTATAWEQR